MQTVGRSATSNASLQLHCATPKRLDASSRRTAQAPKEEDVRSSRYRLLDEREKARESQEIERIVRELKAQRRPNAAKEPPQKKKTSARSSLAVSPKPRRAYDFEDDIPPAYDSVYSSTDRKSRSSYAGAEPASPQWSEGGDEAAFDSDDELPSHRQSAVTPLPSTEFQEQVLRELQRLKEAQRKDLEAIQKLQREKAEAERKAKALEATLRSQRHQQQEDRNALKSRRSRPQVLELDDGDAGDESVAPVSAEVLSPGSPPPRYANFSSSRMESELDFTDGEEESSSPMFARPVMQQCDSPVFSRSQRDSRPTSAQLASQSRASSVERSANSRRPQSARSSRRVDDESVSEELYDDQPRGRSASQSSNRTSVSSRPSSRPRSASRDELRRSCAFYEAKLKAQQEEEERERETQQKLDRAARATPPANLLKRQAEAQRKKQEQLQKIEKERDAELAPARRVRARDVPPTTYLATDSFATNEEREQARKERVMKRSQALLAQAELPTRMKRAQDTVAKASEDAADVMNPSMVTMSMSVKMRRKLQEQLAEEERRKQLMKPKPVPNFTYLQRQWDKELSAKKSLHKPTEPQAFFSKREREVEELKARKEARKQKMAEQEEQARREEAKRKQRLVEKVKKAASSGEGPRLTKADELRMKKVQEALRQDRRAKEQELVEKERRELRSKEASRRITAQVKQGEDKRKGDYAGEFVELTAVESVAKERAKKQREQFKEAVQRNKERLIQAVATKPSLMERFSMDLKREEHKKNALEAVVKQVFQKNFKDMKGILTEEEEELARDLVAADEDADADADDGEAATKAKRKKKSSGNSEDGEGNSDAEAGGQDAAAYEDE